MTELRIRSVNVALPGVIGTHEGAPVVSGIAKQPVRRDFVFVGATNIAGDKQADLSVHGGRDKAIYCYPVEHWGWWEKEKAFPCRPGAFGENLTIDGADENTVSIGDRFRWGDALLEVSQPRAPCYKFAIHSGRADAPQIMTVSARCGWYCRVLAEGRAPTVGAPLVQVEHADGPTVREAFVAALHPRIERDLLIRVHGAKGLARSWRDAVARRLSG